MRQSLAQGLDAHLDAVFEALKAIRLTKDFREAPKAWVEKREPQFKGE